MENNLVERQDAFLVDYKQLIDKHNLDFFSHPVFFPTADGTFELRIVTDLIDNRVKSPFS